VADEMVAWVISANWQMLHCNHRCESVFCFL